jgi:hypothetical protein
VFVGVLPVWQEGVCSTCTAHDRLSHGRAIELKIHEDCTLAKQSYTLSKIQRLDYLISSLSNYSSELTMSPVCTPTPFLSIFSHVPQNPVNEHEGEGCGQASCNCGDRYVFHGSTFLFADSLVAASAQLEVASAEWLPIRLQIVYLPATSLRATAGGAWIATGLLCSQAQYQYRQLKSLSSYAVICV